MNKYLKQYIELQKQFRETEGNPDSVRALYAFKEELEQSEDRQAKEVLVDVYDLLDFKKDAYELLCQIGDRSNKKTLKRLGTLKDYAENWGNQYAIPKPKTPDEKQKERERQAQLGLPTFRYHPNPLETGAFEESKEGVVCECCGKMTHIFYTNPVSYTPLFHFAIDVVTDLAAILLEFSVSGSVNLQDLDEYNTPARRIRITVTPEEHDAMNKACLLYTSRCV